VDHNEITTCERWQQTLYGDEIAAETQRAGNIPLFSPVILIAVTC
jgi:hypothetical protein|tara:strand:- start:295 stop:429 length:135 start_codon:yes stop_codon:yes gene_type:complete